ncbi:uncharacterized protein LOC124460389 [Drosophila willistoni]|uniref:uncharacterized protein LOC124460389 n=1 Tax=Drosophila willistoni TaxID=7260 RepID=UPI001F07FA7E|nr:uncharacterized protein LOC124460389 [Drosophila willistoni]
MRLFKRLRAKATSSDERGTKSNGVPDAKKVYEIFRKHRVPAGGPPCSCSACKIKLLSTHSEDRLDGIEEKQYPTGTKLKKGFGTVTAATQTDSIQQTVSSQTLREEDENTNVTTSTQYEKDDVPTKTKLTQTQSNKSKEKSKLKPDKKQNQRKGFWKRKTIVANTNKLDQDKERHFLESPKAKESDPDVDKDEENLEPIQSVKCPHCSKLDEVIHKLFHLQKQLESHEYHINLLQQSVNKLKNQETQEKKDKETDPSVSDGLSNVPNQPKLCDESSCECETLFHQFMQMITKPSETQKTKDLLPTSQEVSSTQLDGNNCQREKKFDLEFLFREFINFFIKPTDNSSSRVCDNNKIIQSLSTIFKPPQTLSTCSGLSKLVDKKSNSNISELEECPCPSQTPVSKCLLERQQSSLCQFCKNKNLLVLDDLINELIILIGKRSLKDVVLTVLLRADDIYHVNVREIKSGRVLGCLLVNDAAIDDAICSGLFESMQTYCVVDVRSTIKPKICSFGIPFEFVHDKREIDQQREQGGENGFPNPNPLS